jgi:D-alanyl-D-alanine carboxypeptidase
VDSGQVISERNSTYPWYPASVTKLMTAYVTLKAVRDRRIDLNSMFTVSSNAVAQNPFKMGFKAGTGLTVDNALKMLMVHSPNDVAVVLAEGVSGSIEKFAEEMNAEAHRLGMMPSRSPRHAISRFWAARSFLIFPSTIIIGILRPSGWASAPIATPTG